MASFNVDPRAPRNFKHSDMLGAAPLQTLVRNLISGKVDPTEGAPYVSAVVPTTRLGITRVTLKSPADLHAYDSARRHTGPVARDPNYGVPAKDQQIPNSSYGIVDSHAVLTLTSGDRYQVELKGFAYGTISLDLETFDDDQPTAVRKFIDVPFSPKTVATMTLQGTNMTELGVDLQGDGRVDFYLPASGAANTAISIRMLAMIVQSLGLEKGLETGLLAKLSAAAVSVDQGKSKTAQNQLAAFINAVNAQGGKAIAADAAKGLAAIAMKITRSV